MVSDQKLQFPIRGYMILPLAPVRGYWGVDRNPFMPTIIEDEMLKRPDPSSSSIWALYPPGWRKDAYRLYEENQVSSLPDHDLDMIASEAVATEILRTIEPHVGPHEILACEVSNVTLAAELHRINEEMFLGYDLAYLGGDYFSAVRAGLFGSPWYKNIAFRQLVLEYRNILNHYGLFPNAEPVPEYLRRFKEEVPSEQKSTFYIWCLTRVNPIVA